MEALSGSQLHGGAENLYVEVGQPDWLTSQGDQSGQGSSERPYYALFAIRVAPRPMEVRLKWRWGFNNAALLEEAADRMRQFVEGQHPAEDVPAGAATERALALRCIAGGDGAVLDLSLVGRVRAATRRAAHEAAFEYWYELMNAFPYDYQLTPATNREIFYRWSGKDWVSPSAPTDKTEHPANRRQTGRLNPAALQVVEVQRFEGALATSANFIYTLGCWRFALRSDEVIWRVLAGTSRPVMLNITLQPAVLQPNELYTLEEMRLAALPATDAALPGVRREAEWIATSFDERIRSLRYPYIMRVHLLGPNGVPEGLVRNIGAAFTHPDLVDDRPPGYQSASISDPREVELCRRSLHWLEPMAYETPSVDPRFARLRYLFGVREALAAFRCPFPPEGGLPGVQFGA